MRIFSIKKNILDNQLKYECRVCENKFTSISNLEKHIKRSHGEKQNMSPVWNFAIRGPNIATCKFCQKQIVSKKGNTSNIWYHVKLKHGNMIKRYNNKV